MKEWSSYYQNPSFFKSSRMLLLDPDMLDSYVKWTGIQDGMKVLDVGCGTGAFTYYLSAAVKNCVFHGVDLDEELLKVAKEEVIGKEDNTFEFFAGDALKLDMPSNTYDLVVSHTFLTNICNPKKSLLEMKRVAKTGAKVVSVTTQSFQNIPVHTGCYPREQEQTVKEYYEMRGKVMKAYFTVKPFNSFIEGEDPVLVPHLFASCGLKDIEMHSIGRGFSLSDARYSREVKETYIKEDYLAELTKFQNYLTIPEFSKYLDEECIARYPILLKKRRDQLMDNIGENAIWEWYGGANIMMTGRVPVDFSALQHLF